MKTKEAEYAFFGAQANPYDLTDEGELFSPESPNYIIARAIMNKIKDLECIGLELDQLDDDSRQEIVCEAARVIEYGIANISTIQNYSPNKPLSF